MTAGDGPQKDFVEEPKLDHVPTGKAQREFSQKAAGNPAERQTEAERINREDALYKAGFPVAGH